MIIFGYWCLEKIVLGIGTHTTQARAGQDKFDKRNQEVLMLIKLLIINDQLPQVPFGKIAKEIWELLKDLHETYDKS